MDPSLTHLLIILKICSPELEDVPHSHETISKCPPLVK